jgi:GTP-binding protein
MEPFEADYVPPEPVLEGAEDVRIEQTDGLWQLEGEWLKRVAATVNFSDYESRMFFDRILRKAGIFDRLEQMGIRDGDTVCIYDLMFDYRY